MNKPEFLELVRRSVETETLKKLVLSRPKDSEVKKISARLVSHRGRRMLALEYSLPGDTVSHKNLGEGELSELSDIIDRARETLNESQRTAYYKEALDIVMELAVELPTYQRSDLFAYNTNIIDVNSLTPASELTPYNGPMSKIWEVSLNETN